jgi:hypothetical protein
MYPKEKSQEDVSDSDDDDDDDDDDDNNDDGANGEKVSELGVAGRGQTDSLQPAVAGHGLTASLQPAVAGHGLTTSLQPAVENLNSCVQSYQQGSNLSQVLKTLDDSSNAETTFMMQHKVTPNQYQTMKSAYMSQNGTVDLDSMARHFARSNGSTSMPTYVYS